MTKMLQGWMIVPALAAAYVLAGPPRLAVRVAPAGGRGRGHGRRERRLAARGVAVAGRRGRTSAAATDGCVWDLILGYNGFGRIFGEGGGMGGGGGRASAARPGLWRMFNAQVGGQIAWLLPLAAVGLVAGLWLTRGAPRTDLRRAGWVLFGVWALVHVGVFCSQQGIFHPYYVSALAPAVAALAGAGLVALWRWARDSWAGAVRSLPRSPERPGVAVDAARPHAGLRAVAAHRDPRGRGASRCSARSRCGCRRAAGRCSPCRGGRRARAVRRPGGLHAWPTVGRALNGNNVLAGPASVAQAASGGGLAAAASATVAAERRPGRRRAPERAARPAAALGRRRLRRSAAVGHSEHARLPGSRPGLGEVPRRRDRLADDRADHHRHRQAGRDDRRLQRRRPLARPSPSSSRWSPPASSSTCCRRPGPARPHTLRLGPGSTGPRSTGLPLRGQGLDGRCSFRRTCSTIWLSTYGTWPPRERSTRRPSPRSGPQ